jgi:exosortase A-associated hydrolase 2
VIETPFFFENGNYRNFGIFHAPDAEGLLAEQKIGMVFCTPFAEEKMIAHRVIVNMARALAAEGISCLRFDFMGEGDSEGNFEDSSVKSRLSDIKEAMSVVSEKEGVKRIGLIGFRFGATLAALVASQRKVDLLVLICPIISGKSYMNQCFLSNLSTQMVAYKKIIKDRTHLIAELMEGHLVNIDGYMFSKDLYEEMIEIDLLNGPEISGGKILVINVANQEKQIVDPATRKLYEKISAKNLNTINMSVSEKPFWKVSKVYSPLQRELSKSIVNWLHNS